MKDPREVKYGSGCYDTCDQQRKIDQYDKEKLEQYLEDYDQEVER